MSELDTPNATHLLKNPIVEAVVDIDCVLPPTFDLAAIEPVATAAWGSDYPVLRQQHMHETMIEGPIEGPEIQTRSGLQALMFTTVDGQQIVQARLGGYSFNRLAGYTSFDDYLPEIERTWRAYTVFAGPIQVRQIGLRYINRIGLPRQADGRVKLDDHLALGPQLADDSLIFTGFLHRHAVLDPATGNQATITLTTHPPVGGTTDDMPIILDIAANAVAGLEIADWPGIDARLRSLRLLKNRIFERTLTPRCLQRYRLSSPPAS